MDCMSINSVVARSSASEHDTRAAQLPACTERSVARGVTQRSKDDDIFFEHESKYFLKLFQIRQL